MVNIPVNFSGQKFAIKYNLDPLTDFRVEDDILFCPSLPNLTDSDLLDCVVTQAELDELTSQDQARDQLKAEYTSTITTLQTIEGTTNPTNAQVVAAVKFLAKTLRLLLKFLAKQYK